MKIPAMIFGRAPRCHRSSRQADGARACASRVVAERVVVETVADRFARMSRMAARSGHTQRPGSSHAHERLELLDRLLAGGIVLIVQRLRLGERGLIVRPGFLLGTRH